MDGMISSISESPKSSDCYLRMKTTTRKELMKALKIKKEMNKNGSGPIGLIVEDMTMPVEILEDLFKLKVFISK